MSLGYKTLLSIMVIGFLLIAAPARSQEKFNLKLGARGKICLDCHGDLDEKLKSPFVHTPVKEGKCTECHSPHASSHGKLLAGKVSEVCYGCHESMTPQNARSNHKVVLEGNCLKCHNPHASNNKFNLIKAGNELCFECHKNMGETVAKVKFRHNPVEKGCLNCHNPHSSPEAPFLLKKEVPSLCMGCHSADKPALLKAHMNYPVSTAYCTSCHNPHGSDRAALLLDNVHPPVASKMCRQCHEDPASPSPFKTQKAGFELCKGCHYEKVNEMLSKAQIHWPAISGKGCLNCHRPHASKQENLLKDTMINLCGNCHSDTVKKHERTQTKHEPVKSGLCTVCHSPHASDSKFLFNLTSVIDLCRTCHEAGKHAMHPMGDKVLDPRNRNLTVQCLSCHSAHYTEHKYMLLATNTTELCVQCHEKFKR